jgi:hypothetical protein
MFGILEPPRGTVLEDKALRLLIRTKIADGRLPISTMPLVWGGPASGQQCVACEEIILKVETVLEGATSEGGMAWSFHPGCFFIWCSELGSATSRL